MRSSLKFDHKRATQALNFFARKEGGPISKLKAIKLVYFADRYHLRKYGRTLTDDVYFALEKGPIASNTLNVVDRDLNHLDSEVVEYASKYINKIHNRYFESICDVDMDQFSDSDLEALNYIWDRVGAYDIGPLIEMSHQLPEWKKHEAQFEINRKRRFLIPPEDLLEDFADLSDDFKSDLEISYNCCMKKEDPGQAFCFPCLAPQEKEYRNEDIELHEMLKELLCG